MKCKGLFGAIATRRGYALRLSVAIVGLLLCPRLGQSQIRTVILDSAGDVGKYSSIAVDLNNCSHISYYDATHQVLRYARICGDNLSVTPEVVDHSTSVGRFCAIAVDKNNNPHISYYDATNKDLKYAVKHGSSWTVETVDAAGDVGLYTSIAIDQVNNPYISYYNENGYLKLAYKEGGFWEKKTCCQVELCEGISLSGRSTAIRLDQTGSNPLILFFDCTSKTLKLGIYDRNLNEWHAESLRDADVLIQDLSFCLDTGNQPHVAFSEVSTTGSESVQYGKKTCLGSGCLTQVTPTQPTGEGTWNFEQVDAATGEFVSLALDDQNLPWVSYYDPGHGLRRAQKTGTEWSVQTVDPGLDVGLYCSIALDHSNAPHISYYDQLNGDLKYASTIVPRPIDVWIKDCSGDNGKVPSTPFCAQWQSSPDIFFDNNGDGTPDNPAPGVTNTIKARVRNRGFLTAYNVAVKFYLINVSFPLPANINDAATLIGHRLVTVSPHHVVTTSVHWTPPAGILTKNWCIGVVLDHRADHAIMPFMLPSKDNNFAVHCFLLNHP